LGEVFDLQQGASMSPKRRLGRNPRPFLRTKNILWGTVDVSSVDGMDFTEEEVRKLRLQPGDLLVCEGGDVGRTAIWEGQLPLALYQNHIHRLRAKDGSVEPRFVMYWMQAAYQVFLAYQGAESRTAIPNLSGRRLKEFLAPLPPLEEQRRIVARIEELMGRVREARRLRQEAQKDAERLWQSVLAQTFPRPGSDLPEGWRWVRLREVCETKMGGTPSTKVREYWEPPEIVWVTPEDMERQELNRITSSRRQISVVGLEKSSAKLFPAGAVLLSTTATIGKVGIAEIPLSANQQISGIICSENINHEFIAYYLLSVGEDGLRKFGGTATATHINQTNLKSLPIPLPPLSEQRRIVAHLQAVQEKIKALKEAQSATDSELKRLEQAILEKAFRGEL
jgi:type I restriction enzyme S subunit